MEQKDYSDLTRRLASDLLRRHWIKLFLARQPDGNRVTECLVDNLPHAGTAKLKAFKRPTYDGVLGLRSFTVFVERSRQTGA